MVVLSGRRGGIIRMYKSNAADEIEMGEYAHAAKESSRASV